MYTIIVNYIYKQIRMEDKLQKILYSFRETYFLINIKPYGRSFSPRRYFIKYTYIRTEDVGNTEKILCLI